MSNPLSDKDKETSLPERPATVPANARFIEGKNNLPYWVKYQTDPSNNRYTGEYAEWDLEGHLLLKMIYHDTGGIPEEVFTAAVVPEKVYNDHYIDSPVINRSRHYSYNNLCYKEALYDERGQLLYTVSQQHIPTRINRRYYNDIRIYEMIAAQDEVPVSVRYFYGDGTVMAAYKSNGDGTGVWNIYSHTGQLLWIIPLDKETFVTSKQRWPYFLPDWTSQPAYPTIDHYVDAILKNFRKEYDRVTTTLTIQSLPIPGYLQGELNKFAWHQMETAFGTGEELPANINGLITGDDHIAEKCAARLWWSVGAHGGYFDAAYATAILLARMLAVTPHTKRLLTLIYKIFSQPALRTDGYAELVANFSFLVPQLRQWSLDADPVTARQSQHILLHAGQGMPDTVHLFQQEWQNVSHPVSRRAYALFCLGRLYEIDDADEEMRGHFVAAYQQEPLLALQTILAIFLLRDAGEHVDKHWTDTLIQALNEPDTLQTLDMIDTFTGYDAEGFLEMMLEEAGVERS
ncbi:hypothetical protein [Chitinophaga sp.]|uniref:hypothetical protein n=1 Tax=Chitinophaga sp. TaxID=1869181 RepID=UPI0031D002E2